MSSIINPRPQKFVSRIDQRDYDVAISKLSYEIQLRKKEFLTLCAKHDPNYTSHIKAGIFGDILNKFTVYPNEYEKKLIIFKSTIDDEYIDYISIADSPRVNEEPYQDLFLQHLNDERFINYYNQKNSPVSKKQTIDENKNIKDDESQSDLSNDFGLLPIEILNAEINEENFLRKVSKDLMTYILTHTKGERPKEFTHHLFKSFDFDNDDKYTIGEFNNFLIACELVLSDADLRFFYENFPIIDGRVAISQINEFIEINSEKNFENPKNIASQMVEDEQERLINDLAKDVEEKLENQKNYQKEIEDKRIVDMTNKNYITNILKDCLLIFGRDYLMRYFGRYLFNHNNRQYIEDNSFILGICSFGYKSPSSLEIGNFKYICIHKNIAHIRGLTNNIILNFEALLDFIIGFYEIGDMIKVRSSEELINSMGETYCNTINESIINLVVENKNKEQDKETTNENEININQNINTKRIYDEYKYRTIGEKDFRKKFINSFGFIDHHFFDKQIHNICGEQVKAGKEFNPNLINAKKFLEFSYNFVFLYILKNYKSLGIFLDSSFHQILNDLYLKIKSNIFPRPNNAENDSNKNANINYEDNPTNIFKSIPTEPKSIKNTEPNLPTQNDYYNNTHQDLNIKNEIMRNEYERDAYGVNKYNLNTKLFGSIKINDEEQTLTNKYKSIRPVSHIVNANPIEAIPLLYNTCVKYLINKFKLERVHFNLLKGIGICKIFRDHLNSLKGGKKPKIYWSILIQNLEGLVPEVAKNFLMQLAFDNKDNDGNIHVQFFFSKLEQILLQYNLSLDEEKNLSKYYI